MLNNLNFYTLTLFKMLLLCSQFCKADINNIYLSYTPNLELNLGDGFNLKTMGRAKGHTVFKSYDHRIKNYRVTASHISQNLDSKSRIHDQVVLDVFNEFTHSLSSNNKYTEILVYSKSTYTKELNTNSVTLIEGKERLYSENKTAFRNLYSNYFVHSAEYNHYFFAFVEIENGSANEHLVAKVIGDILEAKTSSRKSNLENSIDWSKVKISTKYVGANSLVPALAMDLNQFKEKAANYTNYFDTESGRINKVNLASYDSVMDPTDLAFSESSQDAEYIKERYLLAKYYRNMYRYFLAALGLEGDEELSIFPRSETIAQLTEKYDSHIKNLKKLMVECSEGGECEFNYLPPLPPLQDDPEKYLSLFNAPINVKMYWESQTVEENHEENEPEAVDIAPEGERYLDFRSFGNDLLVWLDGSDLGYRYKLGDKVDLWEDKGPKRNDFTPVSNSKSPSLVSLNESNGVRFSQKDQIAMLHNPELDISQKSYQNISAVMAYTADGKPYIWSGCQNGFSKRHYPFNDKFKIPPVEKGDLVVDIIEYSYAPHSGESNIRVWRNGELLGTQTHRLEEGPSGIRPGAAIGGQLYLKDCRGQFVGYYGSTFDLGEFLMIGKSLSQEERDQITSYLLSKWS